MIWDETKNQTLNWLNHPGVPQCTTFKTSFSSIPFRSSNLSRWLTKLLPFQQFSNLKNCSHWAYHFLLSIPLSCPYSAQIPRVSTITTPLQSPWTPQIPLPPLYLPSKITTINLSFPFPTPVPEQYLHGTLKFTASEFNGSLINARPFYYMYHFPVPETISHIITSITLSPVPPPTLTLIIMSDSS